jgi:hypothetical protein
MMSSINEKPPIFLPSKVKLILCQRNDPILPPRASRIPHTSPPLSLPFQAPPPPPPAPSVSTEEEEPKWAFLNEEFIDISSDRLLSGNNIIEDLEERDIDGLPELPPSLRPTGYHNPGTRL